MTWLLGVLLSNEQTNNFLSCVSSGFRQGKDQFQASKWMKTNLRCSSFMEIELLLATHVNQPCNRQLI